MSPRRLPRHPLRSLAGRLLLAVGLPLALLVLIGATVDYVSARRLTDESHDRALASLAVGLSARLEAEGDGDLAAHLPAMVQALSRAQPDDPLHYLVLQASGAPLAGDLALATLRRAETDEDTQIFNARLGGQPVRVVQHRYRGPDARATILVAETVNGRRREARELLYVTAATNLAIALAVVAAALVAVRFALRPLDLLGERLERHEIDELRPLPLRLAPHETVPLLRAINRLVSRVRATARARQAFIDGTAHQLRTPLASLSTQVDLLSREALPAPVAARVAEVSQSVQRLSHLAHQMLALARAGGEGAAPVPMGPLTLSDLLQDAANASLDAALARHVDLGFETGEARVIGSRWLLRELLLNLVGNAIQHTPEGSTVTARCGVADGRPFLEVEDDGPGIPPADRARVFERYVRLNEHDRLGSGLGLAIVREIAERHGAQVSIHDGPGGRGSRVRVDFQPLRMLSAD
ncbi:sensor histidine kinase [Ideonella sp. 4Y16]|uniref:sensor histidine kinase n=1 Tax=Ideonella alba TaxID=2824118 RepID=UPI001B37F24C|nr:sensor histidine kinase [Ideonella alba]MBQ0945213.1 sensor histidine kinase [Ideonella alba]